MLSRALSILAVLTIPLSVALAPPVQGPPVDAGDLFRQDPPIAVDRADTLFFFAAEGPGSYGTLGTSERGYDFDGTGECFPAGWTGFGAFSTLRTNNFLPGTNESCMWTFFDPDTTEPGYPMGVYPYGPPYQDMYVRSPILNTDQHGEPLNLEEGSGSIWLSFDLYKDFPLDAVVFYYPQLAIHTSSGGYALEEVTTVFYGEDGWVTNVTDITELIWSLYHEPDDTITGIEIRFVLTDLCPIWCDVVGSGYPHTLEGLFDNISLFVLPDATGLPDEAAPAVETRLAAHPNPFNPKTRLSFDLAVPGETTLSIHDLAGRQLRRLKNAWLEPGPHEVEWNARDENGHPLPSGIYLAVLEQSGRRLDSTKVTLLK